MWVLLHIQSWLSLILLLLPFFDMSFVLEAQWCGRKRLCHIGSSIFYIRFTQEYPKCNIRTIMAKRFEKYQIESLKMAFEESEHLSKEKKIELVRLTGLDVEQIASWYNRRRARKRVKESRGELERINKDLKQSLRERLEYEAKLQKELRDSKKREAELQDENQRLKRQLTIVEGDSELDSIFRFMNGYP